MYSNSVTVIEQLLTLQTLTYFSTLHIFLLTIRVRTLGKLANMLFIVYYSVCSSFVLRCKKDIANFSKCTSPIFS